MVGIATPSPIRALFMGTGDIALPAFGLLARREGIRMLGLVTGPDVPVGRKQVLTPPRIKERAEELGVPVHQPDKLRPFVAEAAALAPDLIVVMAYGKFLPQALLDVPRHACLNLHASLLPRHRGASPIQAAIRDGDATTGVTVMHMVAQMDAGDIVLAAEEPVRDDDTGGSLHDRLAGTAALALGQALDLFGQDPELPRTPQDDDLATYCGKLAREDGALDWSRPADELARLTRAYHPWPGTYGLLPGGAKIKIFPATAAEGATGLAPATLSVTADGAVQVTCGEGSLLLGDVQAPGRKRMAATDFLRGAGLPEGARLG